MMELQQTIPNSELDNENRFDFLINIHQDILRMDEVHPSDEDDWNYIFLIWLKKETNQEEFFKKLSENITNVAIGWEFNMHQINELIVMLCRPDR